MVRQGLPGVRLQAFYEYLIVLKVRELQQQRMMSPEEPPKPSPVTPQIDCNGSSQAATRTSIKQPDTVP
jgi:hypothetical protein